MSLPCAGCNFDARNSTVFDFEQAIGKTLLQSQMQEILMQTSFLQESATCCDGLHLEGLHLAVSGSVAACLY